MTAISYHNVVAELTGRFIYDLDARTIRDICIFRHKQSIDGYRRVRGRWGSTSRPCGRGLGLRLSVQTERGGYGQLGTSHDSDCVGCGGRR